MRWLSLAVALCACQSPSDPDRLPFEAASATATPEPSKPGPYPVGVRTVTFEDTGRPNLDGSPRRLVTEIWYPATQDTRGKPGVSYDVKPLFTAEQQAMVGDVPILETTAVRDAPIAATHGPFPLVIFSHGQAAVRWQSTYLTVLLASHGYIVASCDHEGGTLYDVVRGQLASPTEGIDDRPLDVRYIANRLSRMPASDPLAGMSDLDRFGVVGHSFGALTAMRVTVIDPRVKAIVPQAPTSADLAFVGYKDPPPPHVPIMLQGAKLDQTLDYGENVLNAWAWATSPKYLLAIETGGHFTFSDLCQFDLGALAEKVKLDIPGADVKKVLTDGCGPGAPSASVALPLIAHFSVGFFNARLLGSTGSAALLTQAQADGFGEGVAEVQAQP